MNENQDQNETVDARDLSVLATVDRVANGELAAGRTAEDRETLELLGLLPYALEPRTPSPALRGRIVARAAGKAGPGVAAATRRRRRSPWVVPLAAALAVALLGISAWQQRTVERQQQTIAQLSERIRAVDGKLNDLPALVDELARHRRLLAMATAEGAEFCLLKPVGMRPAYPAARGTMVVSADRDSWYLRVRGLGPTAPDRTYKIWFHTEQGLLPGPAFRVDEQGAEVEIQDGTAPDGVRAISVTEERDAEAESPGGPRLLYADEAMRVL